MEIKRKGIIFALDAALAVTVVIIILINSSYYFSTSSKESLSQLQPVRIGSDVMALLDFAGDFDRAFEHDSEDHLTIPYDYLNVSTYLPKNYAMRYAITDMKETPTITPHCTIPGTTKCVIDTDVYCDGTGCTLDPGEWIRVKPWTVKPSEQANIINQGQHFVAVGTNQITPSLTASLHVDNGLDTPPNLTANIIFDADTGVYYFYRTTNPITLPYFEAGDSEHNWITLTNTGGTSFQVKWIRVVGDESYMRGAYSEDTMNALPIDRFVGTGERFIAVVVDGNFEGYHLVRYWIWLKTVSS